MINLIRKYNKTKKKFYLNLKKNNFLFNFLAKFQIKDIKIKQNFN